MPEKKHTRVVVKFSTKKMFIEGCDISAGGYETPKWIIWVKNIQRELYLVDSGSKVKWDPFTLRHIFLTWQPLERVRDDKNVSGRGHMSLLGHKELLTVMN